MSTDTARRKKATRGGRQRGCYIYIPAEMLQAAGIDPKSVTPHYRLWSARPGSVLIRLYKAP